MTSWLGERSPEYRRCLGQRVNALERWQKIVPEERGTNRLFNWPHCSLLFAYEKNEKNEKSRSPESAKCPTTLDDACLSEFQS
jgi:hypothetical protein